MPAADVAGASFADEGKELERRARSPPPEEAGVGNAETRLPVDPKRKEGPLSDSPGVAAPPHARAEVVCKAMVAGAPLKATGVAF